METHASHPVITRQSWSVLGAGVVCAGPGNVEEGGGGRGRELCGIADQLLGVQLLVAFWSSVRHCSPCELCFSTLHLTAGHGIRLCAGAPQTHVRCDACVQDRGTDVVSFNGVTATCPSLCHTW